MRPDINLSVKGKTNKDAAWYYYETYPAAKKIENYVAFDRSLGVKTGGTASDKIPAPPHP